MNRFFRCFCINQFGLGPLQNHSSRSDFGFEFVEIFVFEKQLPAINHTGSRRLCVSVIRGVADSPYQWYADTGSRLLNFLKENSPYRWYGESSTPRISDRGSHRLPISMIHRVADSPHRWSGELAIELFKRKLSVLVIRRVNDSLHQWVGELATPRIGDTGSRQLRVSVIRWVSDSPYRWLGKSLFEKKN